MPTGFEAFGARLDALAAAVEPASIEAVQAASETIYGYADEGVPRGDTEELAASGHVMTPKVVEGVVTGGVSYGSAATVTEWHGVGYEIFVEFGTSKQPATHFLTEAVMAAVSELPEVMGAKFRVAITRGI